MEVLFELEVGHPDEFCLGIPLLVKKVELFLDGSQSFFMGLSARAQLGETDFDLLVLSLYKVGLVPLKERLVSREEHLPTPHFEFTRHSLQKVQPERETRQLAVLGVLNLKTQVLQAPVPIQGLLVFPQQVSQSVFEFLVVFDILGKLLIFDQERFKVVYASPELLKSHLTEHFSLNTLLFLALVKHHYRLSVQQIYLCELKNGLGLFFSLSQVPLPQHREPLGLCIQKHLPFPPTCLILLDQRPLGLLKAPVFAFEVA